MIGQLSLVERDDRRKKSTIFWTGGSI